MKHPGRLGIAWTVPCLALRPSVPECRAMLAQLERVYGEKASTQLMGVPVQTFRAWRDGRIGVSGGGIRAVWLVHCLTLRPERCQSLFDLATWGRFRVEVTPKQPPEYEI